MKASSSLLISASRIVSATTARRRGRASEVGLAAASLLPPLPLYRRILRAHRYLPIEMRSLGDIYVKDEFRKHEGVENPLQIVGFLTQWKIYLDGLEENRGFHYKGKQLDVAQFEKVSAIFKMECNLDHKLNNFYTFSQLSEEQLYQLHELMTVTKEVYDPLKAKSQPPGGQKEVQAAVEDALERAKKANDTQG